MTQKELFIARLLSNEALRKEFLEDPKAVLEKEGLKAEDLEDIPLKILFCPTRPSAKGVETCTSICTETCPAGPGTKIGSITGTVIKLATPTSPEP